MKTNQLRPSVSYSFVMRLTLPAAHAIAGCIKPGELSPEYIVPSVFNREVVRRVTAAVEQAAIKTRVARKRPGRQP